MEKRRNLAFVLTAIAALFIASTGTAFAQSNESSNIKIKNFGQMDARFFRGAQPSALTSQGRRQLTALNPMPGGAVVKQSIRLHGPSGWG